MVILVRRRQARSACTGRNTKIVEPFRSLVHLCDSRLLAANSVEENLMTTVTPTAPSTEADENALNARTAAPEEQGAEDIEPRPHRCLILANGKAGSIRTAKDRIGEAAARFWHKVT